MFSSAKDITEQKQKEEAERERRKFVTREFASRGKEFSGEGLDVYYCRFCATYCLIVDQPLDTFPIRKCDETRVIEESKHKFSYELDKEKPIVLLRGTKKELQYRLSCTHCHCVVGYRSDLPEKQSQYLYIYNDALSDDPLILEKQIPKQSTKIPTAIEKDPDNNTNSIVHLKITYNCPIDKITNIDDQYLYISLKVSDEDEAKSNSYLLQYICDMFSIPVLYVSLAMDFKGLLVKFESKIPEDIYLKVRRILKQK
ncbi:hypothetical protein WA158_007948 [Blastocystis sp. Blastoise]